MMMMMMMTMMMMMMMMIMITIIMNLEDLHTFWHSHWHICTTLPLSAWAGWAKVLEMVAQHEMIVLILFKD